MGYMCFYLLNNNALSHNKHITRLAPIDNL